MKSQLYKSASYFPHISDESTSCKWPKASKVININKCIHKLFLILEPTSSESPQSHPGIFLVRILISKNKIILFLRRIRRVFFPPTSIVMSKCLLLIAFVKNFLKGKATVEHLNRTNI
eukprot:NODE_341_length_9178_cov_1.080846.p10 type:complete len:118 gc:universal NODE_341_length_9178_cov_1.080846:6445-6798(+)